VAAHETSSLHLKCCSVYITCREVEIVSNEIFCAFSILLHWFGGKGHILVG
jgi:hypothetical protein